MSKPSEYKFDDCKDCQFKGRRPVCQECDSGEMFEELNPKDLSETIYD